MRNLTLLLFTASLAFSGAAMAQPAPAAAPPSHKATSHGPPPAADRSPISKSCSTQADAKNLHGKDREKFRRACMKGK